MIVDEMTNIFQNHIMGFMKGHTIYIESTDDEPQPPPSELVNLFADKSLLCIKGAVLTHVIGDDGQVQLHNHATQSLP